MVFLLLFLTSAVTAIGFTRHDLLDLHVGQIGNGEWWRMGTVLLIHDNWLQFIMDVLALLLFGTEAERIFGGGRLLVLYLVGGVAGGIAGCLWQPFGASPSLAILGLVGGLLLADIVSTARIHWSARIGALYWVTAFSSLLVWGIAGATAYCGLLALLLPCIGERVRSSRIVSGITLLAALGLVSLHVIHGPSILAGVAAGALMLGSVKSDDCIIA